MDVKADGKTLGDEYLSSWKIIAEKVELILNPESKATVTFEPLYTRVYRNVCNGFSERMHFDLIMLCARHLININQKLCSNSLGRVVSKVGYAVIHLLAVLEKGRHKLDENSVEHLLSVYKGLRAYLLSVKIISSIFSYLNKFYVACYLNADLCVQLSSLFSKIVINNRISTLMNVVEESLKTPFSIPPEILHHFFNELHEISSGEYSVMYLHLFSRYCPNVLPDMKESDLKNHKMEVFEFKNKHKQSQHLFSERHGVKRPAEEPVPKKIVSCHNRQQRNCSVTFQ